MLPNTDPALLQLHQLASAILPLPPADWEAFARLWIPHEAKRKEILTAIGDRERYLYFVVEGVQRVAYFDDHDREATLLFTYAPSFGGVLDSLLLQTPARYGYETLTASRFLRAPFSELHELMLARPLVERFVRQGVTAAMSGILARLAELQCFTAEERYRELLRRSPHLLQRVPHKYLANYLGIDATHFSKLLNRVRI